MQEEGYEVKDIIIESKQLNEHIRQSEAYRQYLRTKQELYEEPELCRQLQEFRRRNYELQNKTGINPYDEVKALVTEYDVLLHNSKVSDFLQAEQMVCKMMQKVFTSITEGLEFDYLNE